MVVFEVLYELLIEPIFLFLEFIFSLSYRMISSDSREGISIIVLSLVVNIAVLPLYRRADKIQKEEREKILQMKFGVAHIKKTFRGDERFMMLRTYYRQNDYNPLLSLKSSLSILLEIPFFIAAYAFLSDLAVLQNKSFGPIMNLGEEDRLLYVCGITINLLPLLMTGFNIVSGLIYSKGLPLKNKIQFMGIALVFLVLLYGSPAGVVFYWTLNNLFSLLKNVVDRQKNPKKVVGVIFSCGGIMLFVLGIATFFKDFGMESVFLIWVGLLAQMPLLLPLISLKRNRPTSKEIRQNPDSSFFYLSGVALTVLVGVLIPSSVIKSSPSEFVDIRNYHSALNYVFTNVVIFAGLFLVWGSVFFLMMKKQGKASFARLMYIVLGLAVVNSMFFRNAYGTISSYLVYENKIVDTIGVVALNLLINALLAYGLFFLLEKAQKSAKMLLIVVCAVLILLSLSNVRTIYAFEKNETKRTEGIGLDWRPQVTLSESEKNIVVIMLDRAISIYYPFLIQENPKLKEQFAGFAFYPNTISYGAFTNMGSPALFGGYEYVPEEMNRRATESLKDKHDEAIKVMPVLFEKAGFEVTVLDPVYAGYNWIPDLSIYDDYPGITVGIAKGYYTDRWCADNNYSSTEKVMQHNFFMYSIFRTTPIPLNDVIYDSGQYNRMPSETERKNSVGEQIAKSASNAEGISRTFIESFSTLEYLSEMTEIKETEKGSFIMMSNDTTHEPMILQEPEYTVQSLVDNTDYDKEHRVRYDENGNILELKTVIQMEHYHANMAALSALGDWFDYLRAEKVYDNTRIILVSDHGRNFGFEEYMLGENDYEDILYYNAFLLEKDFNATVSRTQDTFMTNADTPILAMKEVIPDPINPFTGKQMNDDKKALPEQHIAFGEWSINKNNGNQFKVDKWLAVRENALDINNWRLLEENR